jgi:hypothetical protein
MWIEFLKNFVIVLVAMLLIIVGLGAIGGFIALSTHLGGVIGAIGSAVLLFALFFAGIVTFLE